MTPPAHDQPAPPDIEPLRESQERFVALWGQMGSNWGIPRTMAEVHALLFVVGTPLNMDTVMDRLGISRGNASMTLRKLADWGLVTRTHRRGDRKEYYEAEQDIWKMFRTIIRERKKKELDPLLEELHHCRDLTRTPEVERRIGPEADSIEAHNRRLDDLLEFMHIMESISQRFISPSGKGLELAARLLSQRAS